jgi:lactam utilization protein B
VDSLCVHGDNDAGIAAITSIRQLMNQASADQT